MDVGITHHALQRWRERAARYADEDFRAVIAAWREARPVADDEPLPPSVSRRDGFMIRRHEPTGCYMVAEAVSPDYCRVVTVLAMDREVNRLVALGKAMDAPRKRIKQSASSSLPSDIGALVGHGPDHPDLPPMPSADLRSKTIAAARRNELAAERRKVSEEYGQLCKLLTDRPEGLLRDELRERAKECQKRLREIRKSNRRR